ncbi:MAG TPA: hypothetical protein VIG97_14635 [Luteimonas sp.]
MLMQVMPGLYSVFDQVRRDQFGGHGWLGGSLPSGDQDGRAKILNEPAVVQIVVLEPITWAVVARTVSRPDGTWKVLYLDPGQLFTIIGRDWEMRVNSAIQDWVQPAPMDP